MTDFDRLKDPTRREHFVYRAFDEAGRLLYVGCSMSLERRMGEHRAFGTWWPLMARLKVSGPYNYATARRLEKQAIQTEDPSHSGQTPRAIARRRASHRFFDNAVNACRASGCSDKESRALALVALNIEYPVQGRSA